MWQQGIPYDKEKHDYDDHIQRDLELENIAGNLMIAEYQLNKLEQRLSQHIRDVDTVRLIAKKHPLTLSNMVANGTSFQLK